MSKAEEEPTSWSATGAAKICLFQIPAISAEFRSIDLWPGQLKAKASASCPQCGSASC